MKFTCNYKKIQLSFKHKGTRKTNNENKHYAKSNNKKGYGCK